MKRRLMSRRHRIMNWLRAAVTENLALKAFSMAVALGLTAYQRGSEEAQQRTVPVELISRLPNKEARRELMTVVPPSIHVTVRGNTRALDQLIQSGIPPVELDLRRGDVHTIVFEPDMLKVPPGVQVNIIDPPKIELEWQNVIQRSVPIQASMTGRVAEGYTVQAVKVDPTSINVLGPASLVEVMQFVRVAAFDVSGKTDGVYRHRLALDAPGQLVEYLGPASATVTVTIARQLVERKFTKPVSVLGPARAKVEPQHVDVTLIGPPEVINGVRDDMVIPRADLEGAGIDMKERRHGALVLPVRVDLAKVEVEVQPPTVSVTW